MLLKNYYYKNEIIKCVFARKLLLINSLAKPFIYLIIFFEGFIYLRITSI